MPILNSDDLYKTIVGKPIHRLSTDSHNRYYITYYNIDNSYARHTYENSKKIGKTVGTFEIIDKHGYGYIKRYYKDIYPTEEQHSSYCPHNPNSVFHTNTLTTGPYKIEYDNKICTTLSFISPGSEGIAFLMVYK
jgi:hypothetical protein